MDGAIPTRHCTVCGRHMKFEGESELAGTAIVRFADPVPNQVINLFSCDCGRIESAAQELAPSSLG